MAFRFEQLKVYQLSLQWVRLANNFEVDSNIRSKKSLLDQLSRAALSIPLNIAEGSGRFHDNERRQYFRVARGSIFECVAVLHVMRELESIETNDFAKCYTLLDELSRMVSGLIKAVDSTQD